MKHENRLDRDRLFERVYHVVSYTMVFLVALLFTFPLYWIITGSFKGPKAVNARIPVWFPTEPTMLNYDKLFTIKNVKDIPEDKTYNDYLNPESLQKVENALIEKCLDEADAGEKFQFVRNGFFCVDAKDSKPDALVFNRIVSLKSSFKLPK